MAEMKTTSADSLLMRSKMVSGRCRETQSFGGHSFAGGFEGYDRDTVGQCHQAAGCAAKRMADKPDVGIWIDLGDVAINLLGSIIVAVLVVQGLDNAC
jgi:hypothetical protein